MVAAVVIGGHRQALDDLRGNHDYIAKAKHSVARRAVAFPREQEDLLAYHPEIGRQGRVPRTRELAMARLPHVLAYRERGTDVEVSQVVHTSRCRPDQMPT